MGVRNTDAAYGSLARFLHWSMAIVILASLALIEIADVAPRGSATRAALRDWHAQTGLVVLAMVWFAWAGGSPATSRQSLPRPRRGRGRRRISLRGRSTR
jgi:cytochrome b561